MWLQMETVALFLMELFFKKIPVLFSHLKMPFECHKCSGRFLLPLTQPSHCIRAILPGFIVIYLLFISLTRSFGSALSLVAFLSMFFCGVVTSVQSVHVEFQRPSVNTECAQAQVCACCMFVCLCVCLCLALTLALYQQMWENPKYSSSL